MLNSIPTSTLFTTQETTTRMTSIATTTTDVILTQTSTPNETIKNITDDNDDNTISTTKTNVRQEEQSKSTVSKIISDGIDNDNSESPNEFDANTKSNVHSSNGDGYSMPSSDTVIFITVPCGFLLCIIVVGCGFVCRKNSYTKVENDHDYDDTDDDQRNNVDNTNQTAENMPSTMALAFEGEA